MHAWGEGGCVYRRGRVCVHGEREGVYMKGSSVHAWGEGGSVCAYGRGGVCMERGRMCVYGSTVKLGRAWEPDYVHGEREGVYMEGVECAWGEVGCVYGRGGVCVHG